MIGVVFGIIGGLIAVHYLSRVMYGIRAGDPVTFLAVTLGLIAISVIASCIPAVRAASVDTMIIFRQM